MIQVMLQGNELFLMCTTAEDSARLSHWMEHNNPILSFKEFYGMNTPEPAELPEDQGGLHLTQTGYVTRQIGSSVWNKNVLK